MVEFSRIKEELSMNNVKNNAIPSETIIFMEFVNKNTDIIKKLKSQSQNYDLSNGLTLEFIENEIIPIAEENGFKINPKDILNFENQFSGKNSELSEETLEKVAGGKMNNRFLASGMLGIALLTGISNLQSVNSMVNNVDTSSTSASQAPEVSVRIVKNPQNNELTSAEKEYFQNKIGSEYKIISTNGKSGSFATVYDLEDMKGNKFVLKIPNKPIDTERWIAKQTKTRDTIQKYYKDYNGELKIPNYVKIGQDFIIEENLGEQLTYEEIGHLSLEQIDGFAKSMAEFLAYTHKQEKGNEFKYVLGREGFFTLKDCYDYLNNAGVLNESEQKELLDLIEKFNNRDTSDETSTLTHCDIRLQNIVYNPQTKKFGIIDFEMLNTIAPMYYDFTSGTVASFGFPYDIASKTIDYYNEISDVKVNKEKIKMFHKLGTMFEYCYVAKVVNRKTDSNQIKDVWENYLKPRLQDIEDGFLEVSHFETEHFKLEYPKVEEEKVKELTKELEKNYGRITTDLDVSLDKKTFVKLFKSKTAFQQSIGCYGASDVDWITGVGGNNAIKVRMDIDFDSLRQVIVHEFTHVATEAINSGHIPFVFMEGIATYEAGQKSLKESLKCVDHLPSDSEWLIKNNIPGNLRYGFAYSFTEFIVKNYGYEKIRELLKINYQNNEFHFDNIKDIYSAWRQDFLNKIIK